MTALVGEGRHGGGGGEGGPRGTRSLQFTLAGWQAAGADFSLRRPGGQVGLVPDLVAGVAASVGAARHYPPAWPLAHPGRGRPPCASPLLIARMHGRALHG